MENGFSSRQTQPGKVTLTFPFTYLSALLPHLPSRLGPCSGGFLFEVKRSHRVPSSSVGTTQDWPAVSAPQPPCFAASSWEAPRRRPLRRPGERLSLKKVFQFHLHGGR